jgi:hypothetical protein
LKDKDFESAKVIEHQMKRLSKLQETITHLKQKLANNNREFEERNKSLRDEKEALQTHFQELKRKMNLYRENERKKLTELTVLSNRVVHDLKKRVDTAEKILKLVEMNRKLESEEERMMSFQRSELEPELQQQIQQEEASVIKNGSLLPEKEQEALRLFFRRYNKVLLDTFALDAKKKKLQEENDKLKLILKEYLEGISISEEILAKKNTLLVVNNQTNAP